MTPTRSPAASDRLLWAAGIVFVVALVTEGVVATGIPVTHEDSAAKIARELDGHRDQLLLIAYFSIVYAVAFAVYPGSSTASCAAPPMSVPSPPSCSSVACSS